MNRDAAARAAFGSLIGALPAGPGLARSARAGMSRATVRTVLAAGGWHFERTLPGRSGTAVILVRGPGGEPGTVKVSATGDGAAGLRAEREVLTRLGGDERLGGWRALLPVVLGWGAAGAGGYLLTSRLPGAVPRRAAAGLTAAAFKAIAPLHRHENQVTTVDAALLRRWADEPAAVVAAATSPAAVAAVTRALHAGLAGRQVTLGWVHGDFRLGNVLAGPGGELTGIVDWSRARPGDLPAADLAHWLLTAGRRGLGAEVAARLAAPQCLTAAEHRLLGGLAGSGQVQDDPAAARALLLLTWLRHVAGHLAAPGRAAPGPLWLYRNVQPVLRQLTDG